MLLQHRTTRKILLDIQEVPAHHLQPASRPRYRMQQMIKNAAMQAIAEREKWLDIEDSEAGEHPRWRLTEGPTDKDIGFMIREG
jgi:hypothetical protein